MSNNLGKVDGIATINYRANTNKQTNKQTNI